MITGVNVSGIEMKREKYDTPTGLRINTNLDIDTMKIEKGVVLVDFLYTLNYDEKIGFLKLTGIVGLKEDNPEKFVAECKKTKKLPTKTYQEILSAINFTCSVSGTFFVRVAGFMPNLNIPMPPPIDAPLEQQGSPSKKKAA
jgi:hypothetical protein